MSGFGSVSLCVLGRGICLTTHCVLTLFGYRVDSRRRKVRLWIWWAAAKPRALVVRRVREFLRDRSRISKPNHGVVSAHDNVSAKAGAATVLQRRASRLRRRAFSAANSVAAIDAARARRARASCKHLGLHCARRVLHTHKVAQLAALAVLLRCTPLKKDTSTCFVVATSTLLCSLKSLRRSCAL